jgi:hypothetical protein
VRLTGLGLAKKISEGVIMPLIGKILGGADHKTLLACSSQDSARSWVPLRQRARDRKRLIPRMPTLDQRIAVAMEGDATPAIARALLHDPLNGVGALNHARRVIDPGNTGIGVVAFALCGSP